MTRPMRHGYTNSTTGDGRVVVKRYRGPDAEARAARERRMLTGLRAAGGVLPPAGPGRAAQPG
ncbi:hypothetical protein ACFZDG_32825 [Kitasatospora xanthocidica]|uniref:hypothetical protein n=1 Tax=Kitasatospora xanthocidica TaxID=83382 RepID=UPI0036E4CE09